jgi:hypothetical protein
VINVSIAVLVLCMLAPAAAPRARTSFPIESLPKVEGLRRAGDDSLVVATEHGVYELARGTGEPRQRVQHVEGDVVDARGAGDALELAVTGRYHGAIFHEGAGGAWQVERPVGAEIDDLALAGDGSIFALDREHDTVWAWTGPSTEPRALVDASIVAMFVDAEGQVWLVGDEGALLTEEQGRWVTRAPSLGRIEPSDSIEHVWSSPQTGLVWMVSSTPEVVARRLDGTVVVRHPIPAVAGHVDGDNIGQGDVLAIRTVDNRLLVVGEGRVYETKHYEMFMEGMVLDLEDRAVYITAWDRMERRSIADAFEDRDRRDREAGSVRGRRARKPGAKLMWLPWLAVPMGPRWEVSPADRVRYRLDVELGALAAFKGPAKGLMLLPTVGYGLERGRPTDHLVVAGVGLGWFDPIGGVAVRPRVVYGGNLDRTVLGVRTGVMGFLAGGLLTLEVNHQVTWAEQGQGPRQSVGLEVGLNVLMLLLGVGLAGL